MFKRVLLKTLFLFLTLPAVSGVIEDVRGALAQNNFQAAEAQLHGYRSRQGVTPEYVEALSWMARGALASRQFDQAQAYAKETSTLTRSQLKGKKLDTDEHLATALGASYEVQAQVLAEQGKKAQAAALLRTALVSYGNTSIGERLQKNLNLISLVGSPAPALVWNEYLGTKPATLSQLKGKPVLLFFWAHWCADCKGEVPIIARLKREFGPSGLVVIGPTQLYGYAAHGDDATPAQEKAYIESVRQRYYASLIDMSVPLSKSNFNTYGASTTPTLVILERSGKVAMYHPGAMQYEELRAAVEKVVK